MAFNKIGFHIGSQPNAQGYGDYIRALDAAGIPAVCMSVGGEGIGDIVGCWDKGSTVPHVVVVRYMPPPGHPDGTQDVPRYDMTPEAAFVRFWAWTKPLIGPDVRRYSPRIVIKIGNELDKGQSEWLAEFYQVGYDIMQSDPDGPFRQGAFSFSSGEPEPEHWRGPNMRQYLQLCADDPIGAAICLHEYSYADTLQFESPFKIGRFQDLFAACDEFGIKRPYVYIHEWGWEQGTIPGQSEAMAQLPWAAELYAKYPEIRGAGLWSLQSVGGYHDPDTGKHISQQVQPMIEPITNYSLTARFPDPPPTDPPNGGNDMALKWNRKIGDIQFFPTESSSTHIQVSFIEKKIGQPDGEAHKVNIPIPPGTGILRIHEMREEPDENPNPPPVELTLTQGSKGVDVSAHQGEFDWETAVSNGITYAIVRSSNGTGSATTDSNGRDVQLKRNAAELTRLGLTWGIYHYLRPDHSIQAQIDLVYDILTELKMLGTYPTEGVVFDDGTPFPIVWPDVERFDLTPAQIKQFYDAFTVAKGHYTRASIWDVVMAGIDPWWSDDPLWCADYGANDGSIPNRNPIAPQGFKKVHLWQYSSSTGAPVGWPGGLDLNVAGPYDVEGSQPDPPTPPAESYNTAFMRSDPKAWRVIRRVDGSGEDVWDLPLGSDRFVRVKNTNEGEWYNKNLRERDTSPSPQPDGTERLYLLNGGAGGQIAPDEAVVGVTYSYTNQVQFKAKQGCADLSLNSGTAASTFLLKEVIPNYVFPTTGFKVDVLFWTVQTGENQLYAIKDGVRLGWVGGGAQQENNVWGGELAELYFDRSIPQVEPPRYCG